MSQSFAEMAARAQREYESARRAMKMCTCGHEHIDEVVGVVIQGGCTGCECMVFEPI